MTHLPSLVHQIIICPKDCQPNNPFCTPWGRHGTLCSLCLHCTIPISAQLSGDLMGAIEVHPLPNSLSPTIHGIRETKG